LSPAEKIERQLGMSLDRAAEILCWPLADLDPRLALFYRRTDHPDKLRRRPWHTSVLGRSACVPGYFTKIEVADPRLMVVSAFAPVDRRRFGYLPCAQAVSRMPQRTRFETVVQRKLRRRKLTDDGNVEISGRDLR